MRFCLLPKSIKISLDAPLSVRNCGVNVLRISSTRANAVITNDRGAVTDLSSPLSSCHCVFIDIESLPTGIVISNAGHNSSPTAFTASYKPASSPGCPAAAIQLADILMRFNSPISEAAILVIDSATAIRAEAP